MARRPLPLPQPLSALARLQAGLVSTAQCVAAGVTRQRVGRLVRAGVLVTHVRGVHELVGCPPAPTSDGEVIDRRRRRAAFLGVLAHGPTAVATGLCALVLLGVHGAPARIRPEVALRHGGPSDAAPEVRVRRTAVRATRVVDGIECVTPEVALAQAVPELDRETAVALMDSARHRRVMTARQMERARALATGRRGARRSRGWWEEHDPRSQSPAETRARLRCADAGFPADVVQLEIRDPRAGSLPASTSPGCSRTAGGCSWRSTAWSGTRAAATCWPIWRVRTASSRPARSCADGREPR